MASSMNKTDNSSSSSAASQEEGGASKVAGGTTTATEPELSDLESSLLALEKLDRASPDLWPDQSKLIYGLWSRCKSSRKFPEKNISEKNRL